uniref:Rab-GAP TBC domain-containing protein n=1 Tax=Tetradesmus obliquus TaxID=3088 RepID=A0A383W6G7_TETOB|eukprot:jgi/Sobl393_1/12071/SZX72276.1
MPSKAHNQQYLLGLGAAGAVAVIAASALAVAVSRRRRQPYSKLEWEGALEEIGEIRDFDGIVDRIADEGLEPSIRPDVWPFLLEVFDPASHYQQRQAQHQLMLRQYQQLLLQCQAYEAALKESLRPSSPSAAGGGAQQQQQPQQQQQVQCQLPEQVRQFAEAHRLIVIDAVRTDFQKHTACLASLYGDTSGFCSSSSSSGGSISVAAAAAASSLAARPSVAAVASLLSQGLSSLQQYWLGSLLGGQAAAWGHSQALWVSEAAQRVLESCGHMGEDSKRQACRMIAMLSAYALHDPDTGYCQGMSDLLLPFVLLMEDDALAFWCFVSLMQRQNLRRNFAADESGIFAQLRCLGQVLEVHDKPLMFRLHQLGASECHFAYRMLVVLMRRDLSMAQVSNGSSSSRRRDSCAVLVVMQLWEVLWADAWRQRRLAQESAAAAAAAAAATTAAELDSVGSVASTASMSDKDSLEQQAADAGVQLITAHSRGQQAKGEAQHPHQQQLSQEGSTMRSGLFVWFVAAVVISQRRTVLGHCCDADDVLRLFHGLKRVDVWQCLAKARELQDADAMQQQQQQPQQPEQRLAAAVG